MEIPTERPEGFFYAWFSQEMADIAVANGLSDKTSHHVKDEVAGKQVRTVIRRMVVPQRFFGMPEDGTEVEYTSISASPEHGMCFGDIEFVGLVEFLTIRTEDVPGTRVLPEFRRGKA